MIRVARRPEPVDLPPTRLERLAEMRAARAVDKAVKFRAYDIVKPQLAEMQSLKCCYCEKREEQAAYRDVDHYRPKSAYWWLAWTWENLLFSCVDCNRQHKREKFPLSPEDQALTAEQAPPGRERPRILDPSDPSTDPRRHIEFRRAIVLGIERWQPFGLTDEGNETIAACGLDRTTLLDLYTDHVNDHVRPRQQLVLASVKRGDAADVVKTWSTACRGLFAPRQEFQALSYDALKVLVSPKVRDRYHLELPKL